MLRVKFVVIEEALHPSSRGRSRPYGIPPEIFKWADSNRVATLRGQLPEGSIAWEGDSKVVGDLAQFMVANGLSEQNVLDKADKLDCPKSVIEYFQGYLGCPASGFPGALRTAMLRGAEALPNEKMQFEGHPGAEMALPDFEAVRSKLDQKHGQSLSETDVMSAMMYPAVFDEWKKWAAEYGNPSVVPTRHFISPMRVGEEIHFELAKGKTLYIKLLSKNDPDEDGNVECQFVMNGEQRRVSVPYTGQAGEGSRTQGGSSPGGRRQRWPRRGAHAGGSGGCACGSKGCRGGGSGGGRPQRHENGDQCACPQVRHSARSAHQGERHRVAGRPSCGDWMNSLLLSDAM